MFLEDLKCGSESQHRAEALERWCLLRFWVTVLLGLLSVSKQAALAAFQYFAVRPALDATGPRSRTRTTKYFHVRSRGLLKGHSGQDEGALGSPLPLSTHFLMNWETFDPQVMPWISARAVTLAQGDHLCSLGRQQLPGTKVLLRKMLEGPGQRLSLRLPISLLAEG